MIRFARFQIVGGLGIVVQVTVLWTLTSLAGVNFLPATAIAVSLTLLHNFLWHTRWTWADRSRVSRRTIDRLVRFTAANGVVSMTGNLGLMALLVGALHLAPLPANLVAIAVCGGLNFVLGDRLVFSADKVLKHNGGDRAKERPLSPH